MAAAAGATEERRRKKIEEGRAGTVDGRGQTKIETAQKAATGCHNRSVGSA